MAEDKTINNIYIKEESAYLSTNFGVIVVDLKRKEIKNTYAIQQEIYDVQIIDSIIYAATADGLYSANIEDNLLNKENWKKINSILFKDLLLYENTFVGREENVGVKMYDKENNTFTFVLRGTYNYVTNYNEKLIASSSTATLVLDVPTSSRHFTSTYPINYIAYDTSTDTFWGSCGVNGLIEYTLDDSTRELQIKTSSILPSGPIRNLCDKIRYTNDALLIAGGNFNLQGINYPGTITRYDFEKEEWISFEEGDAIRNSTNLPYINITDVIQDPLDATHHFAASAGQGLYEFKDYKFVQHYSIANSTLNTIIPNNLNYVRTSGLAYDKSNNLWVLNSFVKDIINIRTKDGNWMTLPDESIASLPTFDHILFDKRGWAWMNSRRLPAGIYCLDTNNTTEDPSDDKKIFRSTFINQDGHTLELYNVLCMAEDKEGAIWLGTNKGPLVIYNPQRIFDSSFYFTQIKVPRNDGSNLADYLLENENIKTICVDGANRKWIGTESSGVYLLSANGLETIHHFTKDNSPLLSNNILSIIIHPTTGEVFIGTDKGLIAYKSDATEGLNTFDSAIHAYPNPVAPDYEGVITVTGLMKDSNVKIVNTAGKLMTEGTSLGGSFSWDGKNRENQRAASGVYFVLAADKEGKTGIVTKIVLIK